MVAFRDALVNVAGFRKEKTFLMTDDMKGQQEPTNIHVIIRLGIWAKQIRPADTESPPKWQDQNRPKRISRNIQ